MREVTLDEFPEMGCTSVENGNDDFSTCARSIFSKTPGSDNTAEAVQNLHACLSSNGNMGMLVGHGYMGSIRTGGGNSIPYPNQIIAGPPNEWEEDLAGLKGIKKLALFSCWSGATHSGQALVKNLSDVTKATVSAQNSVVFCSKQRNLLYVHSEATWMTASPTQREVEQARDQLIPTLSGLKCLRVVKKTGNGCSTVPNMHEVIVTGINTPHINLNLRGLTPSRDMAPLLNQLVEDDIDFCNPMRLTADLGPTGMIDLTVLGEDRHFAILGNTLLQDLDRPETLYWMNRAKFEEFENRLLLLLK